MRWETPKMVSGDGLRFTECRYKVCGTIYTQQYSGSSQCSTVSSQAKS